MEVIAFWLAVMLVWLFFRLTTPLLRSSMAWSFWTALFLFGGAGMLWSALH